MCGHSNLRSGALGIGFSTMTTVLLTAWTMQEFLPNDGTILSLTHPSHSPDPTSCVYFFSQNGSWYSREGNFNTSA